MVSIFNLLSTSLHQGNGTTRTFSSDLEDSEYTNRVLKNEVCPPLIF